MAISASWVASSASRAVAEQATGEGVDPVVLAAQELLEGDPVAGSGGLEQVGHVAAQAHHRDLGQAQLVRASRCTRAGRGP